MSKTQSPPNEALRVGKNIMLNKVIFALFMVLPNFIFGQGSFMNPQIINHTNCAVDFKIESSDTRPNAIWYYLPLGSKDIQVTYTNANTGKVIHNYTSQDMFDTRPFNPNKDPIAVNIRYYGSAVMGSHRWCSATVMIYYGKEVRIHVSNKW